MCQDAPLLCVSLCMQMQSLFSDFLFMEPDTWVTYSTVL